MKKHYLFIALLFVVLQTSFGQNKNAVLSSTYERSSLTLILIDKPGYDYTLKLRDLFTKVEVPDKYFENKIVMKSIIVPISAGSTSIDANTIREVLNRRKTGNMIISYWYARQADGTMSADRFFERGMYNALPMLMF